MSSGGSRQADKGGSASLPGRRPRRALTRSAAEHASIIYSETFRPPLPTGLELFRQAEHGQTLKTARRAGPASEQLSREPTFC